MGLKRNDVTHSYQKIAALLESEADTESLAGMVRAAMKDNKDNMAAVAAIVASGKSREARNNQLAKLRMIMGRICKELGLPRYTVVEHGSTYAVRPVARKNDPRRYGKISEGLKDLLKEVALLTDEEQEAIATEFRAALQAIERRT